MKAISYHTVDKSTWGLGPWQEEPDKRQWLDKETGYPCLIVRNARLGFLCGYVGVPRRHPAYQLHYDGIPYKSAQYAHRKYREAFARAERGNKIDAFFRALHSKKRPSIPKGAGIKVRELDCHGGLTFASLCQSGEKVLEKGVCHTVELGEEKRVWWFGFDCGHAWDISPGYTFGVPMLDMEESSYKDIAFVTTEVQSLAKQLKALEKGKKHAKKKP